MINNHRGGFPLANFNDKPSYLLQDTISLLKVFLQSLDLLISYRSGILTFSYCFLKNTLT